MVTDLVFVRADVQSFDDSAPASRCPPHGENVTASQQGRHGCYTVMYLINCGTVNAQHTQQTDEQESMGKFQIIRQAVMT